MKQLIVNADDFGLTRGVNRGIVEGHLEGIITSTTLMVNMPAFDEAVELARATPSLGVGLHFNITQGRPVSPPEAVASLVDQSGNFPGSPVTLMWRQLAGRLDRREIETELKAQIERMRSAGLHPTHIDTHKHSHAVPVVLEAIIEVARDYSIPALRRLRQPVDLTNGLRSLRNFAQSLGAAALGALCRLQEERLVRSGMAKTRAFYGISQTGLWDSAWLLRLISELPQGASELMCHPGYDDADLRSSETRLTVSRRRELNLLKDHEILQAIRTHDVELISYGELG
ncbi:MAG: ChbG/HpnK family deacetylase [Acidobacteriota bacterium]|nr:MAG: ChbG/HpnK family deacetylase [Acidobacteriota bacterium]